MIIKSYNNRWIVTHNDYLTTHYYSNMIKWCTSNIGKKGESWEIASTYSWRFIKQEDAVMFMLVWS